MLNLIFFDRSNHSCAYKIVELNALRPLALTSVPMKCAERIILNKMRPYFNFLQDQLQFAYPSRSVDDAITCFFRQCL